jgi:hypothetical protein
MSETFTPPAPEPGPDGHRRLRRRPLADVKITRVRYLWAVYLPAAELTMLVGKPGIGKSTVAAELAAKITMGTLDGDFYGTPRRVLYSLTEDAESVFKARFLAAGGNPDLLHLIDVVHGDSDGVPMLVTADLDELREAVTELQPALVVLDALNSSITGQHNDNSNVRPQLEELKALAHQTGTAVLGIGHFRKSAAGVDPLDAVGGAGAYGQVVRQALACARDDDDGTGALSVIKTNLSSLDVDSLAYRIDAATVTDDEGQDATAGRVAWLGTSDVHVRDLLQRTPEGDDDRSTRDETAGFIRTYLAGQGGSAPARNVLKEGRAVGYTDNQLKKARKAAGVSTERNGFGKAGAWVWTIEDPIDVIGADTETPPPKAPKAAPMRGGADRLCPECSQPVVAGTVRHPECLRASMRTV